ncbi:MAG: hypothetical protein A2583_12935 [Bdellovibrionales bacterium RIFOXYD1_FULL_53_11]|nr:MAG: hypothetical protein A2583_12935 [Bdellovibrionales bacterium RIFOXYD1_FULL_53_11]
MNGYVNIMTTIRLFAAVVLAIAVSSCSTRSQLPAEFDPDLPRPDLETVIIMGINDIHGGLFPTVAKYQDPASGKIMQIERGGAPILAAHIKQLRQDFGKRLLLLDAGDHLQGTLESNSTRGAAMVSFFNLIGVNAAAIGNHEFDFGAEPPGSQDFISALRNRIGEATYPYVVSNVIAKNGLPPPFPKTKEHLIIDTGKVKVGIIGLTTLETPSKTRAEFVSGIKFLDMAKTTLKHAAALRKKGADVIVLLAHAGLFCKPGKAPVQNSFRKPTDPLGKCNPRDEVPVLLKKLPPGTVDAVVSGHTHQIIHHWVQGVPVIQAGMRGFYYNLIFLTYDLKKKTVLGDLTRIEGPIPVCPLVFEHSKDCNPLKLEEKSPDLATPRLHGRSIHPDTGAEAALVPVSKQTSEIKSRIVGHAAQPLLFDRSLYATRESPLANLAVDALRESAGTDFALINLGSVRAEIPAGPVTYGQVFNAFPFDNYISTINMTGRELKLFIRVSENLSRGFFPVSGLKVKLLDPSVDAPSNDLSGNGTIEPWEVNRLVGITRSDGTPIDDAQTYTLATLDFLVAGGDDLEWLMTQFPAARITPVAGGFQRDIVAGYIAKYSPMNTIEKPLVNPANPRLVFVKKPEKNKKKKRRRR